MKNNLYKNMKTNTITKKQQEDALPSMLSYLKFRFQKQKKKHLSYYIGRKTKA